MVRSLCGALILFACSGCAFAEEPPSCDMTPIKRTLNPINSGESLSLNSIELSFAERKIDRTYADGRSESYDVLIPTVHLRAPLTNLVESIKQQSVQKILNSKPPDIDIENIRFDAPTVNGMRSLSLPGRFDVEKWWKMDGVCCKWFDCHRCEWKTRVMSRTVEFTGTLGNLPVRGSDPPAGIVSRAAPVRTTLPLHTGAALLLTAKGETKDDRSDLEKIWDFVAGLLEAIESVFNGHDSMQIKDFIGKEYPVEESSLDAPNVANRRAEPFGYDENLVRANGFRTYESRDAWDAFNAGLFFSDQHTGFVDESGKNLLLMTYEFDYDRYTEVLNSSSLGARLIARHKARPLAGPNIDGDILDKYACNLVRPSFARYMDALAAKFNGADKNATPVSYTNRAELAAKLQRKYLLSGAEELFRNTRRPTTSTGAEKSVVAPAIVAIANDKWIVPAQGNLWAVARQNNWSAAEYRCAQKVARKRSGSVDRVYPFQSFAECADVDTTQAFTASLFESLETKFGPGIFTPFRGSGPPIRGDIHYRGWYYCYQNPSICAGAKRVTWWRDPSGFEARGGMHKGMDLIHGIPDENIPLLAAVDGQLIYNNSSPNGWGHAIIIPFEKDQIKYLAVYAHLPPSAKSLDGKIVKLGDSLGQAGCSGNAGNGSGQCNNYCRINAALNASDVHLHFELLKKDPNGATSNVPVNPTSVIPLTIKDGPPRRLYVCQES